MSTLFAFLHHIAAFALVSALVVEFVLVRGEITLANARRLQRADLAFGIAAAVILIVGFLRLMYFEKGAIYYMHSTPFIAKLALFVTIAVMSIYPTVTFLSWRKATREGRLPVVDEYRIHRIRSIIHWELAGIVVLVLCAAMAARGAGMR